MHFNDNHCTSLIHSKETNQIFATSDEDQWPSFLKSSCKVTRLSRDENVVDQDSVIGPETTALVRPDSNDHAEIKTTFVTEIRKDGQKALMSCQASSLNI